MSNRALEVIQGEVRDITPVLTPEAAKAAMELYQATVSAITGPEDYQTFRDKDGSVHQFRKRSGWKKLERFFFVSLEIVKEQVIHAHDQAKCMRLKVPDIIDCGCKVVGARVIVRALDTRSGRYSDNAGVCMITERRVAGNASLHDLQTRAFNRAANRATADLLGVSDPSAEEKQSDSGFSKEERNRLAELFREAPEPRRNAAMQFMEEVTGIDDSPDRAVYIAFLREGDEAELTRVMEILQDTGDEAFDPDDVPIMEEKT